MIYNIGGKIKVMIVTVLPPIKLRIAPKLGRLWPIRRITIIVHVLNRIRFQLNAAK